MIKYINVGNGIKIRKSATTKDNAEAKQTLNIIKMAIKEGKFDSIWKLTVFDNKNGKWKNRIMSISEIDKEIEKQRADKIDDIEFALYQMSLFSKYLKKNVHASSNGYSTSMILNFIPSLELGKLIDIILEEKEKIESSDFVEGKFNNQYGKPETLRDRLHITISNNFHNKLENQ